MDWMLMPYRRYFDFSGRSCRREYWMFQLLVILVLLVVGLITMGGGGSAETGMTGLSALGILVLGAFALASFIPGLAVTVRRFHDQDKSGWLVLLQFIPYVGWLIVMVFMLLDGTRGSNRFGSDPKVVSEFEGLS